MDLTASTGKADSSGVWGSGLLTWATGLGNVATGVITALNTGTNSKTEAAKAASQPTPTGPSGSKWIYWALGGAVLVAVVYFMRRK